MKLKAIHNKKFGKWVICHDKWCARGETSIVATVTTTLDDAHDARMADALTKCFNALSGVSRANLYYLEADGDYDQFVVAPDEEIAIRYWQGKYGLTRDSRPNRIAQLPGIQLDLVPCCLDWDELPGWTFEARPDAKVAEPLSFDLDDEIPF